MKNILLSQALHQQAMDMLRQKYNVLMPEKNDQQAFEALLPEADGLILRVNVELTEAALRTAHKLKIISRTGVGLNNVPLQTARELGIIVTNTPDANSISVGEHAVALMLSLAKFLPEYDRELRTGGWDIRHSCKPFELYGKTVGIIGLGRSGRVAASILHDGFQMRILAYGPSLDPAKHPEYDIAASLEEVFERSDIVSLHCPSTSATRGMVNAALLSKAKPGLMFINCSRGDVVVEGALIAALQSGKVASAGLDVFEDEPVSLDNLLLSMDNVVLTPHSAALTQEASVRMFVTAVEQIDACFSGQEPKHIVR